MMLDTEDPTRLPGTEIDWNNFDVNAVQEDSDPEDNANYLWDIDTNFDMFKLTLQELKAL